MELVDLKTLSVRESDQIEWKENVADTDDVVATISAFANDWSNLGGGCAIVGLSAARLKEEFVEHGELKDNPWILRIRGNPSLGRAKHCRPRDGLGKIAEGF